MEIAAHVDAFQGVAAHSFVRGILETRDRPAMVVGETVTDNYFDLLAFARSSGEAFTPTRTANPVPSRSWC